MPKVIELIDVSPRDGLQNQPEIIPTEQKLELIERLIGAGLRRVEVASFVNPKRVPQMADVDTLVSHLPNREDVTYIGLVMNRRGFERLANTRLQEANCVVLATESFNQRNQGCSIDETLTQLKAIKQDANEAGVNASVTIGASFGCPFEGVVDSEAVVGLVSRLTDLGFRDISLADTIGCAVPTQIADLVGNIIQKHPAVNLRCHFHNTRNTAISNIHAAIRAGVRSFEASTGGIGGCPFAPRATGNVATEDVLYLLQGIGLVCTIDPDKIIDTANWIQNSMQIHTPGMVSSAGWFPERASARPG